MHQNYELTRTEFINLYNPLIKGYSESFKDIIDPETDISSSLFSNSSTISLDQLFNFVKTNQNTFLNSFLYRLIGVREIIYSRENKISFDTKVVWDLISNSIKIIPIEYTISSIGSQGFLSIPLYKYDDTLETFDFIRLHIWDSSLDKYMDLKKCEDFSIHTHTFFAESWVITGKIINNRFDFILDSDEAKHSFFKVIYNDSLNEVNQHTSMAVNKKIDVELFQTSEEIHFAKGHYEIYPGHLHKSGHQNSPHSSATFFSFTGKNGLDKSIVIGPKSIDKSEVNRKRNIDPVYLMDKIQKQLK